MNSPGGTVRAGAFVYVSNADDGEIGVYGLTADGALQPGERAGAAKGVGSLAVSPDRRFLHASVRSELPAVYTYSIESATGSLALLSTSPLAAGMSYLSLDRTGRFLFGASYHEHCISVNAVAEDGHVDAVPLQVIPVGRHAHAIRVDGSNRFVYVPSLGTDQVFQFLFDEPSGRLTANAPAAVQVKPMTGPRHFVTSRDDRFLYMLNELHGTITTFALDGETGLLTELGAVSGLPAGSTLVPGAPRGPGGSAARDTANDIWAADIQQTPDGRFLYMSERTSSMLAAFTVDTQTGRPACAGHTATERQPRGFAIDPTGRFLVACGEKSATISVYGIDPLCGALRLLQTCPGGKGANWVAMVGGGYE